MKKILFLLVSIFFTMNLFAQAPQKMSYQAVIRNADNSLVSVKPIGMRISVLQGLSTGVAVYVEKQNGTTNANGLVTMQIGAGTIVEGAFEKIDWSKGPYYIKIETDPNGGSDYTIVGSSELLSVPYALFALNTDVTNGTNGINGTNGTNGLNGTNGAKGNSGAAGLTGQDGTNGINGSNGTNGAKGDSGAAGLTGQDGTNGSNGNNGNNGAKGDIGAIGVTGQDGTNGVDGTTGTKGEQGLQGIQGVKGEIGISGVDGATGSQGLIGLTGVTGVAGINGTNGVDGATGLQGSIGVTGVNGVAGINGTNGVDGATGLQGLIGLTGATGLQGSIGVTGVNGVAGINGTNGVDGATGLQGSIGVTGAKGDAGINGTNGVDGATGLQGLIGLTGVTGVAGLNGIDGSTGAKGDIGSAGTNGAAGNAGSNGVDGATGAKGETGVVGDTTSMLLPYLRKLDTTSMLNPYLNSIVALNADTLNLGIRKLNITDTVSLLQKADTAVMLSKYLRGIVLPINGGTGIANDNTSTLALSGANSITFTTTGITTDTLPISGTLATEAYVLANSAGQSNMVSAGDEIFTFATVDTAIQGMTITPAVAGKYAVSFNSQFTLVPVARTPQATIDLNLLYNDLIGRPGTNVHEVGYANEELKAGIYTQSTAAAATNTGTITLNGEGHSDALFIFKFAAAWSTAEGSNLLLINGATANNVYWIAEGAMSTGANSNWQGTLISHAGAVSMGLSSTLNGRMLTISGAVSLNSSTITLPTLPSFILRSLSSFAMFTILGNVTTVGSSTVGGDLGTDDLAGAITGFGSSTTGTLFTRAESVTSAKAFFSIYKGNSLVPNSTRSRLSSMNGEDIDLQGIVEVADGEAINIRWRMDAGSVKIQNRIFTIMKVQ